MKLSRYLCATALVGAIAALPAAAFAQAGQPTQEQDATAPASTETEADTNDVVVTGSRIRRPNEDSPVPITTVTA